MHLARQGLPATHLIHDNDAKFGGRFDAIVQDRTIAIPRIPPRSPTMNAYAERWVQSIQSECLDHFIVLGTQHLDYLVHEYVDYYHTQRPHQGIGNRLIDEPTTDQSEAGADGEFVCEERLGGVLKSYHRRAA